MEACDERIIACATLDFVRALGIDYGERRIGLALSDATGLLASPWKTIANDAHVGRAAHALADEIRALQADDPGLGAIVLGLPRRLSGEPNAQTDRVRKLAALLATMIVIPITFQDERLTSHEADQRLASRERDWRRRKAQVDALAAAIILQDYLDSRPRPAPAEESDSQ
jgi:putative pre-16S rRNA nuclease